MTTMGPADIPAGLQADASRISGRRDINDPENRLALRHNDRA